MKLRPYQVDAIAAIRRDWAAGLLDVLLVAATGAGKAQPLTSRILTPRGWTTMGELSLGDCVIGSEGQARKVIGVFPQGPKQIYGVHFSDGTEVRCCAEHLWAVQTKSQKGRTGRWEIRTLESLMDDTHDGSGARKWFVPVVNPVTYEQRSVPLDAYVLGALIGDGYLVQQYDPSTGGSSTSAVRFSSADAELIAELNRRLEGVAELRHYNRYDYAVTSGRTGRAGSPVGIALRSLGLAGLRAHEKFIPRDYLFADIATRTDLLRGLMDTDGECGLNGKAAVFSTTSARLADDVCELVRSLGGVTCVRTKAPGRYTHNGEARIGRVSFRITVSVPFNPFLLPRKASSVNKAPKQGRTKAIDRIEALGVEECQCILVDSTDHLYVTDGYTLTHNTNIFLWLLMEALDAAPARALILAHRQELIEQPIQRIGHIDAEWLMRGDGLRPRVGVVMADRDDGDRELVIATVQSLASGKRLERLLRHGPIDILVTDECFPAGTLVDGRPIETIKVGDEVAAFDEANETIVRGRVSRTFRRLPPHTKLRRLTVGERSVVCTMDHPFLTDCGWRCARDLWVGDWVAIQGDVDGTGLHDLRRDVHVNQSAAGCLEPNGTPTRVLSPGMQSGIFGASVVPTDGGDQPQVCVSTHEDQQSHATAGDPAEAKGGVARDWTPAPRSWWEWKAPSRATATAGECVGVDDRGYRPDKGTEVQCGTPPQSLQAGYRRQGDEDCDRGGWEVTSRIGATSAGCQENSVAHWARLDGVESIESGRDGSFGGVCPDGHVYNLEVEQFHTYIANGFIVHNCHHATAPSYLKVYQALKEANPALRHLGVTATPMRGDGDGLARVYQADSARITIADLVRQGFLVQPRWLGISTGISIAGIKTSGDDFVQAQLAKVFDTEQGRAIVLAAYQQYARHRRAIAFTASVAGAHDLAAAFSAAGIAAAAIDGTTPKDERRRILDAFRRGDIQVVANCQVLTEGFDAPGTSCILMCRPTRSDSQYVQCMGRGLRPLMGMAQPGEDCLILDFLPAETRNIVMAGDVLGLPKHVVRTVTAERETAPGEVQAGFTFDGEHFDTGGTPLEIIARQLDYLQTSPFHWHRRDGWLVLGLGAGSDQVERILVITPAQDGAVQRLYGLYRRGQMDGDYLTWGSWQSGTIAEGDFDTLTEKAHEMAAKWGNAALSSKDRAWHQQPISDGQAKFLRRLASRDELGKLERISKGEAAALVTHFIARQVLRRSGVWL